MAEKEKFSMADIGDVIKQLALNKELKESLSNLIIILKGKDFHINKYGVKGQTGFLWKKSLDSDEIYIGPAKEEWYKEGDNIFSNIHTYDDFFPRAHKISPFIEENEVLKREFIEFKDKFSTLETKLSALEDSLESIKNEKSQILELLFSSASSFNASETTQTLPINIYLDTDKHHEIFEVYDSVLKFINSIGFDKAFEFNSEKGSWYKRLLAKSQEKLTSDQVIDRLKEAEYGIEVNTILKQQSEIDKNQSEALANIIVSLKDIPNAAIRIGALIVVKVTDIEGAVSLQTRTLSIKELHLLNKKPELLKMPKQILQALAKEIKDNDTSMISEN